MTNTKKIKNYIGRICRLKSLMLALFVAAGISSFGANMDFYMWPTIGIGLVVGVVFYFLMLLCTKSRVYGKFWKNLKKNPDVRSFDEETFTCVDGGHRVYLSKNWILIRMDEQFSAYQRERVQSVSAYGPQEDRSKLWMTMNVEGEKQPVFVQYETAERSALAQVQAWLRTDCPYCGAPVSSTDTECPYCHSLLGV